MLFQNTQSIIHQFQHYLHLTWRYIQHRQKIHFKPSSLPHLSFAFIYSSWLNVYTIFPACSAFHRLIRYNQYYWLNFTAEQAFLYFFFLFINCKLISVMINRVILAFNLIVSIIHNIVFYLFLFAKPNSSFFSSKTTFIS